MLKAKHTDLHPILKVSEWLLIAVIFTAAVFALWQVLPINHSSTGALLLFQALQAIGLFVVPSLAVAYLWSDQPLVWLRWRKPEERCPMPDMSSQDHAPAKVGAHSRQSAVRLSLLSMGIIVTAIPLINCLVAWNGMLRLPESMSGLEDLMRRMEEQAEQLLQHFLTYQDGAWWVLLLNLLVLAVLPAIGEELTFRGVLQGLIAGRQQSAVSSQRSAVSNHVAVWVTAFVFSFIHFQFYGFVARMLLGALLGYALLWSGRIQYSMLMHATNNALSVILFYLSTYVWHLPQAEMDALGTGQTWWITALSTPIMVGLIYLFFDCTCGAQKEKTAALKEERPQP